MFTTTETNVLLSLRLVWKPLLVGREKVLLWDCHAPPRAAVQGTIYRHIIGPVGGSEYRRNRLYPVNPLPGYRGSFVHNFNTYA